MRRPWPTGGCGAVKRIIRRRAVVMEIVYLCVLLNCAFVYGAVIASS
jgi:hypothetical protein